VIEDEEEPVSGSVLSSPDVVRRDAPPPPQPRSVPIWAPFAALLSAYVLVALLGVVLIGLEAASNPAFDTKNPPIGWELGLTFVQDVVLVFVAFITVKLFLGHVGPGDLGLRRIARPWRAIGWMVLVFIGFLLISKLLTEVFGEPKDQALVTDVKDEDTLGVLIVYGTLICVVAPFVEELFFRGFMFTTLARKLGPWWGMLIVGVVFGLGHAPAPWISLVALGAFGVGLCLLYWRTESIIPGMALHALNNSITFAAIKDVDPALFAGIVVVSVGAVVAGASAVSARAAVAA
jgi:membrane protease YdiL (CAAX protease family)